MSIIKELPELDRPREKALRYGVSTLTDTELLSIVLGSGYHGENVREISNNIIEHYQGLLGLSKTDYYDLIKFKGVKQSKALILSSIFEIHKRISIKEQQNEEEIVNSYNLYKKYYPIVKDDTQEIIILVILNRRKRIVFETTLYKGTENDVIFSYKEIYRYLTIHRAHSFYLIHTHPNKESKPSRKDIVFTIELFRRGEQMQIPMEDHIIIGDDGYYSFKESKKNNISC
ncbi:MAG: DNA repair protein RadC [Bacilli bacterium]|nr:DNA repair protein RadC [Bacilli bacterium]